MDDEPHYTALQALRDIIKDAKRVNLPQANEKTNAKLLTKTLNTTLNSKGWRKAGTNILECNQSPFNTLEDVKTFYHDTFVKFVKLAREAAPFVQEINQHSKSSGVLQRVGGGGQSQGSGKGNGGGNKHFRDNSSSQGKPKWDPKEKKMRTGKEESVHAMEEKGGVPRDGSGPWCKGCGRSDGHAQRPASECTWAQHPDFNHSQMDWIKTKHGKAMWQEFNSKVLKPSKVTSLVSTKDREAWQQLCQERKAKQQGEELDTETLLPVVDDPLLPVHILHSDGFISLHRCLIDSGAVHNNYVDRSLEPFLEAHGARILECNSIVNGALKGSSSKLASKRYELTVRFLNNESLETECLTFSAASVDLNGGHELFIGSPTIKSL